ncbi:MAG: dTDP-4-dehydrorhamnose reductase [Cyanobacteria bacterium J06638_7]
MSVLLTGATGQLGQSLVSARPEGIKLIASSRAGGPGLLAIDLADAAACRRAVVEHRPDWVVNAGAYTAVDRAESEPELALAVNGGAPRALAEALAGSGGRLLQLSTDFVFSGKQGSPYQPSQARDPLGVYGATKAAGEEAVEQLLGSSGRGVILRTSWVLGPVGSNFALTMLRLHRQRGSAGEPLGVVADQVGCPTSTFTLAAACWRVITRDWGVPAPEGSKPLPPLLHWSDAGAASWYDVAVAVGELGLEMGLMSSRARVIPLTTAQYPRPARRPSYSLLECGDTRRLLGLEPCHWRTALSQVLQAASGRSQLVGMP